MQLRSQLFVKEFILFSTTLVLGLFTAYRLDILNSGNQIIQTPALTLIDVFWFVLMVVALFILMRFKAVSRIMFAGLLIIVVWSGAEIILGTFVSSPWDMIGALALLLVFINIKNVLSHNVAIIVGIAGVSALVGVGITPAIALGALVILSFYDIIAVYKTRHMVKLAESMIESGSIFGFVIPSEFKLFFEPMGNARAQIGQQFMVLGSGDIGLPVIFIASLVRESLYEAAIVGAFALLGVFITHLLFVNQTQRKPMAALPPIATACIIGYAFALLIL